jgi:alpha-mannosidase
LHGGTLPASGSFVKVEPATFVVTAIKQSEEGNGWLVRGYNITGEAIHVTLKPCKRFKKVEQVNLAEEKLATLKPDKDGRVFIPVRGHEIVSVLFRT